MLLSQFMTLTISIHSLRMEGDIIITVAYLQEIIFQSTPSAWRETRLCCLKTGYSYISIHSLRMEGDSIGSILIESFFHFNPLPPHGGRLTEQHTVMKHRHFNPLPPHGGRQQKLFKLYFTGVFQSTPSAWRETMPGLQKRRGKSISIHSLRMEGD